MAPYDHIAEVLSDAARPIDAGAARSSGLPGLPGTKAKAASEACRPGSDFDGNMWCRRIFLSMPKVLRISIGL